MAKVLGKGLAALIRNNNSDFIEETNDLLFNNLNNLYNRLQIPKLSRYGYSIKDAPKLAQKVSNALAGSFDGNPIPFNEDSAKSILSKLI